MHNAHKLMLVNDVKSKPILAMEQAEQIYYQVSGQYQMQTLATLQALRATQSKLQIWKLIIGKVTKLVFILIYHPT